MTALAIALVVPWAAGAVLALLDGRLPWVGWAGVAALTANLVALAFLSAEVLGDGPVVVTTGDWPPGVGITLKADALGVTFALLSSLTVLVATVHEVVGGVRERTFPGLVALLATGLTGLCLTGDVFNFYVFFELAMTTAYILATYGGARRELGAALVFTLVNLLGTFVFLLSVAGLYHVTGSLNMDIIAERMVTVDPSAGVLIAAGFFVAFGVKLGLFPFHFWLPTVYTWATPAVAAILSGGLANIGAYGVLRFGADLLPRELDLAAPALIVIGCVSIIYGGVLAVSRRTAGEMLAYSAIGQVGYMLVAIGVGGPVGLAAAILYAVINALNKTLLFLTTRMRGALVAGAFVVGALSVAGVPPAAGFVGKLELFRAASDSAALLALFFLGGALSLIYVFQIYQYDFWRGERAGPVSGRGQQAVVVVAAVGVLALGVWPEPLLALSQAAAQALPGRNRAVIATALRAFGLGAIYLLVLTSLDPGDVAAAALLGAGVALAVRRRDEPGAGRVDPRAALGVIGHTAVEMVRGTWRTVRFCLGARSASGLVEIPRDGRSRHNVAFWGVLTGEAPDEYPVDVDEERDVLIVHLIDASDPDGVRERHRRLSDQQRKVVR